MVRIIFYVLIIVLLLSFFGISIENVVQSPAAQANFSYVGDLLQQGWGALVSFVNGMADTTQHLF